MQKVSGADYPEGVATALYRRYRPEMFSELIGQTQVTDPLMTALRTNRVNHAYLFSGPRGCGKTTSARILARCLNCAEGPTDTPCGTCPSCVELSRDGGGSLDVVEIDAASHNGVDDARDLRERAVFAPARDRYKIFILDEAHMVTPQGFNALLKIVEEPPEHVKFIFATTEPEKVIGTIRSRTHHYPFRLVPPAQMLDYVQQMADNESVKIEPGVLPLVVRAGGGSVRDTLSLLDQLIAGSDAASVQYERAVALLGYTHGSLLNEVVDAIASQNAAEAFSTVDRVIQTGQDPRRFVEDLLERLRDLIIVGAFPNGGGVEAAAVLRGIQQDELEIMAQQATRFGPAELSRTADAVGIALTDMTGATSPRLHLELMVARILVPAADDSERGALARVERLERRVGVEGGAAEQVVSPPTAPSPAAPAPSAPASNPSASNPSTAASSVSASSATSAAAAPVAQPASVEAASLADAVSPVIANPAVASAVTLGQVKDAWPQVLEALEKAKRSAWMVLVTAQVRELRDGNILVLSLPSQRDVDELKDRSNPGKGTADFLRKAVAEVLGFNPLLIATADELAARPEASAATPDQFATREPNPSPSAGFAAKESAAETTGWATVAIPGSEPSDDDAPPPDVPPPDAPPFDAESDSPPSSGDEPNRQQSQLSANASEGSVQSGPRSTAPQSSRARYGEAVVREVLGASFIEEQPHQSNVVPGAS